MDLKIVVAKRKYVFHQTAPENVARIRRLKKLSTSAELLALAGQPPSTAPRPEALTLDVASEPVVLRGQAPLLAKGQLALADGFTMPDLVKLLDAHVYFWLAATADEAPQGAGKKSSGEARLRIALADLIAANPSRGPLFCRYTSGGPRASQGEASPRGPDLFQGIVEFEQMDQLNEMVFKGTVNLPASTMVSVDGGKFVPLFDA